MSSRRWMAGGLACAAAVLAMQAGAQESSADFKTLYEVQKARTDTLERRVALLEDHGTQDLYVAKASLPEGTLAFLEQTDLSGFVSASYVYNFNAPDSRENAARGFDNRHNEFMLNKAAVTLGQPVEYDAFAWPAGYDAKLFIGEDARLTQTDMSIGDSADLFEANVTVNVPVGNGVKLTAGKFGTCMGYEASYTEENANWSGGLQWLFVEPFTHTGLRASYAFNAEWEVELYAFNGWDSVQDNNNAKSFMAHVNYTPREATTVCLIGYAGPEQDDSTSNWRRGGEAYVEQKLPADLKAAVQFDYGAEDGASPDGGTAQWVAGGLWLIYEPCEKWNIAVRGDYLNDMDGARTAGWFAPPPPVAIPVEDDAGAEDLDGELPVQPADDGMELYSLTLTLNCKPVENLRLAPEVRWDRSSSDTAFDGKRDQVTVGAGAAYFF